MQHVPLSPLFIANVDPEGRRREACFPPGKKKMNRVKSEWCNLLRAIPQVRTLIKHIYFTPPASSAFQLGFWEQKEKVIKSLRV